MDRNDEMHTCVDGKEYHPWINEPKLKGIGRGNTEAEETYPASKGLDETCDDITRLNEKEQNCSNSEIIMNNQTGKIEQTQQNNLNKNLMTEKSTKKCDVKRDRSTKIRYTL